MGPLPWHEPRDGAFLSSWFYGGVIGFAVVLPSVFSATRDIAWMNRVGDISYPVYLIHVMMILGFIEAGGRDLVQPLSVLEATLLFMAATVVVSAAVNYFVEAPVANLMRGVLALRWRFRAS